MEGEMPDLATIGATLSALQGARDLIQGIISARDSVMIQGKVLELQGVILDAQGAAMDARAEQSTLLDRVGDLEKEIARLEAWEAEKQRYELKRIGEGIFTYVVKESMRGSEPEHQLCANCYSAGLKSILQQETRFPGAATVLTCHGCGSDIYTAGYPHPEHGKTKPSSRRRS
jgi:hypothetical protein